MKRFSQFVCVILMIVLVLPTVAFASSDMESRISQFFMCHGAYLEKTSSTSFEVWFDVTAVSTMQEIGVKTVKVQRSTDGVNWTTMKTYSKDDYSQMTDTNTVGHVDCVEYTGASSGCYYRAFVTFYAKNSSGIGEYDDYTSSIRM